MVEQLMTFWSSTWQALRLSVSNDLGLKVCASYTQAQRHYHTQQHLMECLQLWQETQHLAQYSGEIAVALWFHDAVYEPFAANNERQSAAWALEVLQQAGAGIDIQMRVDGLIMATCHEGIVQSTDQALLVDIDLAILGADSARFAEYEHQIQAEYALVPSLIFRSKRREILQGFLKRPTIYSTAYFQKRCEIQARNNLQHAIAAL